MLETVAPILPVRDIERAMAHYRRLGFEVTRYGGEEPYAFCERDGSHLHLTQSEELDPLASTSAVYLYVADADALHEAWAGAPGQHHPLHDTPYGLREAAHVDPDGNLLRYGSWLPGQRPS